MYAEHGNLVDWGASGAKASTKHLELRLEVIQGHAFWDHWKAAEELRINVGFRVGRSEHLRFREPRCHSAPLSRQPLRVFAQKLYI